MSNNRLKFTGLEELKVALRKLPEDLARQAQNIVVARANGAAAEVKGKYPRRTGNLGDGVEVIILEGGTAFAGAVVRNTAKLAVIFENGSQARHNAIGANRGTMPPGHIFVPAMIRARRLMYDDLRDMLRRNGMTVTG